MILVEENDRFRLYAGKTKEKELFDLFYSTICLSEKLDINIFIKKTDGLYVKKHWAGEICRKGGVDKEKFIELQVGAYEWHESGEGDLIYIDPENEKIYKSKRRPRRIEGKSTKEMIKHYKHENPTTRKNCKYYQYDVADKCVRLCCLCGDDDIKLLEIIND